MLGFFTIEKSIFLYVELSGCMSQLLRSFHSFLQKQKALLCQELQCPMELSGLIPPFLLPSYASYALWSLHHLPRSQKATSRRRFQYPMSMNELAPPFLLPSYASYALRSLHHLPRSQKAASRRRFQYPMSMNELAPPFLLSSYASQAVLFERKGSYVKLFIGFIMRKQRLFRD
jgi:hypothetical protein